MGKVLLIIITVLCLLTSCNNASDINHTLENEMEKPEISETEVQFVEVPHIIGNPTPDDFKGKDFFIYLDIVCINAANIDWVSKLELVEGDLLGEIKRTKIEKDFLEWDATVLPIGTKIYKHSERGEILVAVYDETKILYMKMLEG